MTRHRLSPPVRWTTICTPQVLAPTRSDARELARFWSLKSAPWTNRSLLSTPSLLLRILNGRSNSTPSSSSTGRPVKLQIIWTRSGSTRWSNASLHKLPKSRGWSSRNRRNWTKSRPLRSEILFSLLMKVWISTHESKAVWLLLPVITVFLAIHAVYRSYFL